jgi:hypothetical protein
VWNPFFFYCNFYFGTTGAWNHRVHLESLSRVSWTICQDCFQTVILLNSASCVARIIGVSHRRPPWFFFFFNGIEDWTQGLELARQILYQFNQNPFCFYFFSDSVSWYLCLDWPWTHDPLEQLKFCLYATTPSCIPSGFFFFCSFKIFVLSHLFICAYIFGAISPPASCLLIFPPNSPYFQTESILPLSLILLKREY